MQKMPFMEFNSLPQLENTSNASQGAASQLATQLTKEPVGNNLTIAEMVGNPLFSRVDDIDKIGLAQKEIAKSAKILESKPKLIRGLNDMYQKQHKPKDSAMDNH